MRLGHLPAACLLALTFVLAMPVAALADGDPASDILPATDVYTPFSPKIDAAEAAKLESLVAAAKAKGVPFKVAIIASRIDLGAITELYGQSPAYAKFLYSEIRTFVDGENGTLLIAMPGGIGIAGKLATPAGLAAAAKIPIAKNATPTELAAAAMTAMNAVAKANGKTLPDAGGSGSSNTLVIVVIVIAVLAFAAGIALILRGRRAMPEPSEPEPDDDDA